MNTVLGLTMALSLASGSVSDHKMDRESRCPAVAASGEWFEHQGPVPEGHLSRPVGQVTPMLVTAHLHSSWIGMVWRSNQAIDAKNDPNCFLTGSAAYYYMGPEEDPQIDIMKTVAQGEERLIGTRLIEYRWVDAKEGRRNRWFNKALAEKIGWFVDGRGTPMPETRPIALPQAGNTLY